MPQTPEDEEELTPQERQRRADEFAHEASSRLNLMINTDPELRALVGLPPLPKAKRRRKRRAPDQPPRPRRHKPDEV